MSKSMFLNLAVTERDRTVALFSALGFEFIAAFTDENATCMKINDQCYVMLLTPAFFKSFTKKNLADAKTVTEGMYSISLASRPEVDRIVDLALTLGVHEYGEPEDLGFMYSRSFEDFDGHLWGFFFMDPESMP